VAQSITHHVRIVAILNIMLGVLHLMVAGLIAYNIYGVGVSSEFPGFAKGLIVVLVVGALPYVFAGVGLLLRVRIARPIALVIDGLILFEFPVGTPVGIYALWLFLSQDTSAYFAKTPKLKVYSETDGSPLK
jgi:hypothetical protein